MTPSRLPTTAADAHPNKTAPFLRACGTDERLPRHFQSPTYVDSRAAQGLETPPRTSTSHLTSDPKCRPTSAQPRTPLSMAACSGQRTMEATRGNGYAPAWGSLVMMMTNGLYRTVGYRTNGLGLGVQYSPLVRCIIKCNPSASNPFMSALAKVKITCFRERYE